MRFSLGSHQATPVAQGADWVPACAGMTERDVGDSKLAIVFNDSGFRRDDEPGRVLVQKPGAPQVSGPEPQHSIHARSMHEEDGPVVAVEDLVGAAPEEDLATTRATVGTHDHEIGSALFGRG